MNTKTIVVTAVLAVVLVGGGLFVGFFAGHGITFFSRRGAINQLAGPGQTGMMGRGGLNGRGGRFLERNGQRPFVGNVTTISDTSISVKSKRNGTDSTFAIAGSTVITNNGAAAKVSDIKTGDTVFVIPSSDGKTAVRIVANPSFPNQPQANPTS